MKSYPYKMTPEIAFKLGRLSSEDFPGLFYDSVTWIPNVEEFELFNFFKWYGPARVGRSKVGDTPEDVKWVFSLSGSLDESKFTKLEDKLAYIRGRLSSYSVQITSTSIDICFANSFGTRDRIAKWTQDCVYEKFKLDKIVKITKYEAFSGVPATPSIRVEADEEVIRYITGA